MGVVGDDKTDQRSQGSASLEGRRQAGDVEGRGSRCAEEGVAAVVDGG